MNLIRYSIILLFATFALGCDKPKNTVPTATVTDDVMDLESQEIIGTGVFQGVGHSVSGDVEVFYNSVEDIYSVVLSNFQSENGPSLLVYFGESDNDSLPFVNVGRLKSTNGIQRYDFDGSQYSEAFKYVIIWCDEFDVLFGRAEIL